jgi:Arc/MetJ-type ribon-helix-helix transcriptional regulator
MQPGPVLLPLRSAPAAKRLRLALFAARRIDLDNVCAYIMNTERLALRVSDAFLEGLDQLAQEEGLSRAEVIRRAVTLLAFAHKEEKEGRRMGFFTEENGQPRIKEVVAL